MHPENLSAMGIGGIETVPTHSRSEVRRTEKSKLFPYILNCSI